MFDITNEDLIELLNKSICKYLKKTNLNSELENIYSKNIYSLENIYKSGLKYLYGKIHLKNGEIVNCQKSFLKSLKEESLHKCKDDFILFDPIILLNQSVLFSKWSGNNLAVISNDNTLNAFFKNQLLFSTNSNHSISALNVSPNKIYLGTHKGDLIYFDPVTQSFNLQKRHDSSITTISLEESGIMTSSLDGTIFYKRRISISLPILSTISYKDNLIFISNNKIFIYKNNEMIHMTDFKGQLNNLKDLTNFKGGRVEKDGNNLQGNNFKRDDKILQGNLQDDNVLQDGNNLQGNLQGNDKIVAAVSCVNGYLGIIKNENEKYFTKIIDWDCISYKVINNYLIGYGNKIIKSFNLNNEEIKIIHKDNNKIISLGVTQIEGENNYLIAFGTTGDNLTHFIKINSNFYEFSSSSTILNSQIKNLDFSDSGDYLLIGTDLGTYIGEIKYQ